jgi:hypothetical protein
MSGDSSGLGVKLLEGASAGANVIGAYSRARATRGQALYDAAMADLEAEDIRGRGHTAAARQEARTERQVGRVKTQIAGRGFVTGVGTAAQLEEATDFIGRLDALTIRENTRRGILSKQAEAGGLRMRAGSISPGTEAAGTLIGEAGTLARRWREED